MGRASQGALPQKDYLVLDPHEEGESATSEYTGRRHPKPESPHVYPPTRTMRGPARLESAQEEFSVMGGDPPQEEQGPPLGKASQGVHPGGVDSSPVTPVRTLGENTQEEFPVVEEEVAATTSLESRSPVALSPEARSFIGLLDKIRDTLMDSRSWLDSNPGTPSCSGSEPPFIASLLQENTKYLGVIWKLRGRM